MSTPDFELIFQSTPGLYLVFSPDLRIVAATNAYLQAASIERSRLGDLTLSELFPPHQGDTAPPGIRNLQASLQRVIQTGKSDVMPLESHVDRLAGSTFQERRWTAVNTPILDADGQLIYIVHALREVTDPPGVARTADERVGALERRVAELESEMDAFNYSVSHDLRAPLRAIDGFSYELLEGYEDALDETGRDYLRRVRSSSKRMGALIDALLQLSRISRRTLTLTSGIDVSAMARAIGAQIAASDPDREVRLTVEDGIVADADPDLLRIILDHLLRNAWKFTSTVQGAQVHVGWSHDGGAARYFVRDNGVGFDMEYAHKLFGPFQRLHHESEFPGLGIGLATVARIVRRHGGAVWVDSVVGGGTTLYWTLAEDDSPR